MATLKEWGWAKENFTEARRHFRKLETVLKRERMKKKVAQKTIASARAGATAFRDVAENLSNLATQLEYVLKSAVSESPTRR